MTTFIDLEREPLWRDVEVAEAPTEMSAPAQYIQYGVQGELCPRPRSRIFRAADAFSDRVRCGWLRSDAVRCGGRVNWVMRYD